MREKAALSTQKLEKLQDGESVEVELPTGSMAGKVTIYPPCGDDGHEWYRHDLVRDRQNDGMKLTRTCKACDEKDEIPVYDVDELFEMVADR